jgi:hypothetical protein
MCTFRFLSYFVVCLAFWRKELCIVTGEWTLTYMLIDYIVSSPFSFTCSRLPNDAENQFEAALGAVSALRKPYGTMFNVRLAIPILHPNNVRSVV